MSAALSAEYLVVVLRNFHDVKNLGDRTFSQIDDDAFHYTLGESSNSIATIIRHMHGNMISRFTDFLTTDGEKPTRNRDSEFAESNESREQLLELWETGWQLLFATLQGLTEDDLTKTVLIRNEPHSVVAAINRQVSHYAGHVGQIVLLGKHIRGSAWQSLSIPKGKSAEFNQQLLNKK